MRDKKTKTKSEDTKATGKKIETLEQELESVTKERDELLGKLQRVSADYANFQKRVPKQVSDSVAYEKESIIRTLLPTLDNFEHTLQKSHAAESVDIVLEGVRIIYDQMVGAMKSHGVEQIHAQDEMFDPAQHEAMMRKEDPEREDGVVLEEFQKGYRLSGRVIRPSKVVVNRLPGRTAPPEEAPAPSEEAPEQVTDEAEEPSERETETE
ncbi:MAG: nucleotide exchange factor GrpE [Phycisphaerales bacterium]|nr:MAG: nucleotide exchange factor GrpE [Phycisphaerales bacterium]